MGFRINTNMPSLAAQRALKLNTQNLESIFGKLSSGSRITRSADDAAGLAISERLKSNIRSSTQANRNANDGISMIQVAEGGFNEIGNMLTRLRELAIQGSSDTIGDKERSYIDKEYQQLKLEIERISQVTEFNGRKLLNGSGEVYDFQIGINNDPFGDRISYDASQSDATLSALGIDALSVITKEGSQNSLSVVDEAIQKVAENRATLGALQNRLTSTSSNLDISIENMSAANSRIRDLDYAWGAAESTRANILNQAATSVLSQANSAGMNALKLLG